MTLATAGPRYTPGELAGHLRMGYRPAGEQEAIITAPHDRPLLVVAGAGSGKTQTMALRVVWLVMNRYVHPDQVLGLTFTRKAAGELAERVRTMLGSARRALGAQELAGEPTVTTYHAYAGRIVAEHGVRMGHDPATRLLGEAASWQLADTVVRAYAGDMRDVDFGPSYVTDAVRHLAEELSEHLRTADELAAWTGWFDAQVKGPAGRVYADVKRALDIQRARLSLLPMVREYHHRKRAEEAMDFGDQLAIAARVALDHPEVGELERERFRVVLLDEYQDTSHAQVSLLRRLFGGGHPVTAVGDPCQSIYGWRGASAGTLDRFTGHFPDAGGAPARALPLSTSWRNRPEILEVCNALSEPLRHHGSPVVRLSAASTPDAAYGSSSVACALLGTFEQEAAWVAERIAGVWSQASAESLADRRTGDGMAADGMAPSGQAGPAAAKPPRTAVLVRTRRQIAPIERALREHGLPVEVVGLGGLLDTPEVRDIVSTLEVLADPLAGASLLRLLTGPRWRIGPRDIVALYQRARTLLAIRREGAADPDGGSRPQPLVPGRLDEAALIDALDDLGRADRYSAEGFRRMQAYATELRSLRERLGAPLPDLIGEVERAMGLDVEIAVHAADAGSARAHLDAFAEHAEAYVSQTPGATLPGFLAFLAAAESEERGLAVGEVDVADGAVQVLTVHAAKGLEWDVVAVAGLSAGTFPARTDSGDHYLRGLGELPFPLRGDAAGLPWLDLSVAQDQKGVRAAFALFESGWREHAEREERRLAYVAITRPRRLLLCSGYWWAPDATRPRGPSVFLEEIRASCERGAGTVEVWAPPPEAGATNPTLEQVETQVWPSDPLGARREEIERAAAMVRVATPEAEPGGSGGPDDAADEEERRWAYEVDLLLAERAADAARSDRDVALPAHLSVSHLVELRRDAVALARSLRRPLPRRPDPYARRGTAFHRWLEQRFGSDALFDLDELPGAGDGGAADDEELAALQERFLAGEWAGRTPEAVEVPFTTVVGGVVIRGRMDALFREVLPGGQVGYDVIDWKTGHRPQGAAARAAAIQLGAYRLAAAELYGVPVTRVRAGFYYVRDGVTVRPEHLVNAAALKTLISALPRASG